MCDFLGGGGGGSNSTTSTTTNVTKLPDYIEAGGKDLFNQAKGQAATGYQPYSLPRIADFSANQKQAIYNANEGVGDYEGSFDQARGMVGDASTPFDPAKLDMYMNPYVEKALGTAQRKVEEGYAKDRMGMDAKAVSAGALGGDRNAIMQGELSQAKNETIGDIYLQGMSQAYDRAMKDYGTDRNFQMQGAGALSSLEGAESDLRSRDLSNLMTTGELSRSLPQSSLDLAYQDYLTQYGDPYEKINWQLGVLSGQPYSQSSTSTSTGQAPQQSAGQGLLGGAMTAGALYSMFK